MNSKRIYNFAGTGVDGDDNDLPATSSKLSNVNAVDVEVMGINVYIATSKNIKVVNRNTGIMTTLAPQGKF